MLQRPLLIALIVLTAAALPVACSYRGGGTLQAQSLGDDPVVLPCAPSHVVYAYDPSGESTFWLTNVPLEDLLSGNVRDGQIMHLELLWIPKPGATPMDASATNASIRHIIMADGELGVYGGAGFAMPGSPLGGERVSVTIRDASLSLQERTSGFRDLLTPAVLTGEFTAVLDAQTATQLQYAVSQIVTDAIGRSRFVQRSPEPDGRKTG